MRVTYRVAAKMAAATVMCGLTFGCGHPAPNADKPLSQGYAVQQADDPVAATDQQTDPAMDPPAPSQTPRGAESARRLADVGMGGGTSMGGGSGSNMGGGGRRRRGGGRRTRRREGGEGGTWVGGGSYGGGEVYAGAVEDANAAEAACRATYNECIAMEGATVAGCRAQYNLCVAAARRNLPWYRRWWRNMWG